MTFTPFTGIISVEGFLMAGKKWTEEDIDFIKNNYREMSCKQMALQLGRSKRAVEHISANLNLVREPQVGEKLGRLTIESKFFDGQIRKTMAECKCDCGNIVKCRLTSIVQGKTVSCGCYKAEKARERTICRNYKHGNGNNNYRLFRIWSAMKTRCYNVNCKSYVDYGGRGIKICDEWLNDFAAFEKWSLDNGYTESLSIDRINVNGDYESSNCRWATYEEQAANRRNNRQDTVKITAFGETKAVRNWLDDPRCKVSSMTTIVYRIGAGWSPEEAISKPSERKKHA